MAGLRLDGAGQAKMRTLDDAMNVLLRVNGLVEQYALQIKRNQSGSTFLTNLRRQLPTLSEMLKAQFGMIADQVMQMNLASSRGASEQIRVRALREGVGQVKAALEIAIAHVKEKHDLDAAEGKEKSAH
jgi:RNA-splicing ligase RtcB